MKIKSLTLKNFGIHRQLEFKTDGKPVVGLLGKNGSGKSTILESIKYALTGEMEGKLEEAVTVGHKKGYVELVIDKGDDEITIRREVGKTPKRLLKRKGKKITSAKDIDIALEEMLSVDKKAMSNACFLRQGSLNDLLFGTESAREQLFIKLVNLSFCDRYGSIIDTKVKNISAGVEDLNTLIDEVGRQRMDSVVEKELLEKQLKRTVNYERPISLVSENQSLEEIINSTSSEITNLENAVSVGKVNLGNLLVGNNTTSRSQLEEKLSKLRNDHTALLEEKTKLIEQKNLQVRYNNALEDITIAKKSLEESQASLSDNMDSLAKLTPPDIKIGELTEKLGILSQEIKRRAEWLNYHNSEESECNGANCIFCGQELKNNLTAADFEKLQQVFEDMVTEKAEIEIQLETDKKDLEFYEELKYKYATTIEIEKTNIARLNEEFSKATKNIETLSQGAVLKNQEFDASHINIQSEKLLNDISKLEKDLSKVIEIESTSITNESLLLTKKASLDAKYTKLQSNKKQIDQLLVELELEGFMGVSDEKLKQELDFRQKDHNEAGGRYKQASQNFDKINERYVELQSRVTDNESRMSVVDELKYIKEILSRKGLPRRYIEYKFDKLVVLTANNLAILNADFTVAKDESKYLSFTFDRFDGEDQVVLPMNRLSGGQKVRLCIAFLLAVQHELVPDIGFQTFDEPSTHLDEEGVERLCAMFKSLQELLKCIDHQVWVCDHNPLLEESFNTTLRL
jgi:DNA repair exonuclease SbcCD ATPase subunit